MALQTRTLSSLLNGISRQPAILRSQDQTQDEGNTWGSFAKGLGRRPPTNHITELPITNAETAFLHHINRDANERYLVVISDGTPPTIRVFDLETGAEQTVTTPFGTDYLAGGASVLKATTVADYTFIVNSSVKPAMMDVGQDEVAPPPGYYIPGGYLPYGSGIA